VNGRKTIFGPMVITQYNGFGTNNGLGLDLSGCFGSFLLKNGGLEKDLKTQTEFVQCVIR
jgi:hypothetical protein